MSTNIIEYISLKTLSNIMSIDDTIIEDYELLLKELQKRNIKYEYDEWDEDVHRGQIIIEISYERRKYILRYNYWNLWSSVSDGYELDRANIAITE